MDHNTYRLNIVRTIRICLARLLILDELEEIDLCIGLGYDYSLWRHVWFQPGSLGRWITTEGLVDQHPFRIRLTNWRPGSDGSFHLPGGTYLGSLHMAIQLEGRFPFTPVTTSVRSYATVGGDPEASPPAYYLAGIHTRLRNNRNYRRGWNGDQLGLEGCEACAFLPGDTLDGLQARHRW